MTVFATSGAGKVMQNLSLRSLMFGTDVIIMILIRSINRCLTRSLNLCEYLAFFRKQDQSL